MCRACAGSAAIEFRQSNAEHEIIGWIHEAIDRGSAIIINPAAYTFTSIAILDALKMFPGPIIELHISNIHRREAHYHHSYVSMIATAVIAGLGPQGYRDRRQGDLALARPSAATLTAANDFRQPKPSLAEVSQFVQQARRAPSGPKRCSREGSKRR